MIIPKAMLKHADHYKPILKLNNMAQGHKVKVFQQKDTTAQDTARFNEVLILEEKSKQEPKKVDNSGFEEEQQRRLEEKEAALQAARAEKADAKDYENATKLQQDGIVPKYVGTEE